MKTNISSIFNLQSSIIMALGVIMLTACRQESDDVLNYAHQDEMAFSKAESSYAAKFDVMWNGLNANYALWDYEAEHGLNWDKVYEQFRPRFVALDSSKTAVTDKQLKALLDSVIAPLHDGHLSVQLKNHATGKYVGSGPGVLRLARERLDEYQTIASTELDLNYYAKNGLLKECITKSSYTIQTVAKASLKYIDAVVTRLEAVPESERTPAQNDTLAIYSPIGWELSSALSLTLLGEDQKAIERYNIIAYKYQYLHIPYLEPIDPVINEYGLDITYALFNGNIAYLRFDGFKLSAYLEQEFIDDVFGGCSDATKALIKEVGDVWRAWFNAIQQHQKAGDLGGVIIDVRSNGGGFLNDAKFVLGALRQADESGGFHDCDARFKRGSGRFDYSPVMPQIMPVLGEEHVTVTAPVVVLCNCLSVSMAEHTSYGVKLFDNGTLVGTRTFGGFSALSDEATYSANYAGFVGVMNVTPVFCYVPQEVAYMLSENSKGDKVVEGYGIEPDIEVALDGDAFESTGKDNQLDRALMYIRTGN